MHIGAFSDGSTDSLQISLAQANPFIDLCNQYLKQLITQARAYPTRAGASAVFRGDLLLPLAPIISPYNKIWLHQLQLLSQNRNEQRWKPVQPAESAVSLFSLAN